MPKTTAQDYIDRGFSPEMFRKADDAALSAFIDEIIAEQAALLEARIGASAYAATGATGTFVARAERCLVLSELMLIRIETILGNVDGADGIDMFKLRRNQERYEKEAESLIDRIVAGALPDGGDFASGTLQTDHFTATASSLSGLESSDA